jgi:hypothetical protein
VDPAAETHWRTRVRSSQLPREMGAAGGGKT